MFVGLPKDAQSIVVSRSVTLDGGRLVDYKHVIAEAKTADVFDTGAVKLTSSGARMEVSHRKERGGALKAMEFDWYWRKFVEPPPQDAATKKKQGA